MAVHVTGKIVLDTNIFIGYLRDERFPEWVFGRVPGVVRFLSSIVLMELRLGATQPKRRRAVNRLKSAFPSERIVAPAPELYDRAAVLFLNLHGKAEHMEDRLGPMDDILIALTAWRMGATVVTRNTRDFLAIQKKLSGLLVLNPTD